MEHSPAALSTLSLLLGIEPAAAPGAQRMLAQPDEELAFGAVLAALGADAGGEALPETGKILPLPSAERGSSGAAGQAPFEHAGGRAVELAITDFLRGAAQRGGGSLGDDVAPDGGERIAAPGAEAARLLRTVDARVIPSDAEAPAPLDSQRGFARPGVVPSGAPVAVEDAVLAEPGKQGDAAVGRGNEPSGRASSGPPAASHGADSRGGDAGADGLRRPPDPALARELAGRTTAAERIASSGDADTETRAAAHLAPPRTGALEPSAAVATGVAGVDAAEPSADGRRPFGAAESAADSRGGPRGAHADLGESMAGRIRLLVDHGRSEARLRLNPPELGSIDVRISVVDDKTFVQLTASHAAGRDALEQTLPRLRELLAAGGLELGGASVDGGSDRGGRAGAQPDVPHGVELGRTDADGLLALERTSAGRPAGSGRIDVYA